MKKCLIFLSSLLVSLFIFNDNVKAIDYGGDDYIITNNKIGTNQEANIYYNDDTHEIVLWRKYYSPNTRTININTYPYIVCEARYGSFVCYYSQYEFYMLTNSCNGAGMYDWCDGFYSPNSKLNQITFNTNSSSSASGSTNLYQTNKNGRSSFDSMNKARVLRTFTIKTYDITNNTVGGTYNNNTQNFDPNPIPTINISKIGDIYTDNDTSKPIMGAALKVNFSEYNTNKYIYKYSTDLENWSILMQNDSQIILYDNITLYVRIDDLNNNLLASSTYTVTTIDKTPHVYADIDINESETAKTNFERTIYMVTLTYYNMTDDYYSIYYNLTDGTSKDLGYNVQSHTINYVNDDAILTVYIYDRNNNMIDHITIDIALLNKDLTEPYIHIFGHDMVNTKNSVAYTYNNTNDNDHKCYYQFGGDDEPTQESCSTENIIVRHASYNTYLHIYIKDNNNNILDEKMIQLSFFTGYPRLEFESYYSGISKSQLLNIKMLDYTENDKLYYSTDNENWTQLPTQDLNTLYFTENTGVYFKIKRNNEAIADGYYYVEVGSYSVSISEEKSLEEIHNLTDNSTTGYVKSFLKTINVYLKEFSKIIQYFFNSLNIQIRSFLVSIFVLFILMVIILIARGKR